MSSRSNNLVIIENGRKIDFQGKNLQIQFESTRELILRSLGGKKNNFLTSFTHADVLWRIKLIKEDGTSPVYGSDNSVFTGHSILENTRTRGKAAFQWKIRLGNDQWAQFILYLELHSDSDLSSWWCEVHIPPRWMIWSLEFPVIPNISYSSAEELILPAGWGGSIPLQAGCLYRGKYPSWEASFQMLAFCNKDRGLYCAAHDPEAYLKTFQVHGATDKAFFSIEIPLPQKDFSGGIFHLPFPVVIGIFTGNYVEAGRIYREFSLQAPWSRKGRVNERKDIPDWIKEISLWLRPDGNLEENLQVTEKALSYFDVPVALHWYRWHQTPYDTHYPEYFPALPGFLDGIRKFRDMGARVLCYINSRLWDPDSTSWETKKASQGAVRNRDGSLCSEVYGSLIPNNVMCPSSKLWQETIASLVHTLLSQYELDGVYLDQIAAAAGIPCYAENHSHVPGGGSFWREEYIKLLDMVRSYMADQNILVTEENSECWLDQIEVHLTVNTPLREYYPVPLFPVIYSDRVILYGSFYFSPDEPENSTSFRLKIAWALLWGAQPGFIQPQKIMANGCEKEAEFLRNCARVREKASQDLLGGNFEGMLGVKGDNPRIIQKASGAFGGEWTIRENEVLASLWVSARGKIFFLLTNISDNTHKVSLEIPEKVKKKMTQTASIQLFSGNRKIEKQVEFSEEILITIDQRDALFIEVVGILL